jgi:hypothetical protein
MIVKFDYDCRIMINPNEVEKGNYIRIIGKPEIFQVQGKQAGLLPKPGVVFLLKDQQGWITPEETEGITLTPAALHNLGLLEVDVATSGGKLFAFRVKDGPDFIIYQRSEGANVWTYKPTRRDVGLVHELQNLFFSITGKQLEVNL